MKNKTEKSKRVETILTGVVVSAKADKTVSVHVERIFQHPVYNKIIRTKKKYLVHDENKKSKVGDVVSIRLVRPISKRKRWLLVDVVKAARDKEMLTLDDEVVK